jgi:hypothetical protein
VEFYRSEFQKYLSELELSAGRDVIVANLDLEEVIHHTTLKTWKHCDITQYYFVVTTRHKPTKNQDVLQKCYAAEDRLESVPTEEHAEAMQEACAEAGIQTRYHGYFPMTVISFLGSIHCVANPAGVRLGGLVFKYRSAEDLYFRFQYKSKTNVHNQRTVKIMLYESIDQDVMKSKQNHLWYVEGLTLHLHEAMSTRALRKLDIACASCVTESRRERLQFIKNIPKPFRLEVIIPEPKC